MNKRKIDKSIKNDFPFLKNNHNIIYFNSSETSLKPGVVIEELVRNYEGVPLLNRGLDNNGNIANNEERYLGILDHVAKHINANNNDVILNYGTTDAINEIAKSIIQELEDGDEIIVGTQEHGSNVLPWIYIAKQLNKKIAIKWYKLKDWKVDIDHLKTLVTPKTKLMAVALVYNTTGATNDMASIRNVLGDNVKLFVDGAQAIGHIKIDVEIGKVDYLVFANHKSFGTNGAGFTYIRNLDSLVYPFAYGSKMNIKYTKDSISFNKGRLRFISGSQDIAGQFAFDKGLEYIESFGMDEIEKYTNELKRYAEEKLSSLSNINIVNKNVTSQILFFEVLNASGEDVQYHLQSKNIIVRSGASCVRMYEGYNANKTIRVSFHIYNNKDEIDRLYEEIKSGGDFIDALFSKREPSKICK